MVEATVARMQECKTAMELRNIGRMQESARAIIVNEEFILKTSHRTCLLAVQCTSATMSELRSPTPERLSPADTQHVPLNDAILYGDVTAAQRLAQLIGPDRLRNVNQKVVIFDTSTGVWTDDKRIIEHQINKLSTQLYLPCRSSSGRVVYKDYANEDSLRTKLLRRLPYVNEVELDDTFFARNAKTARQKLLFSDGIYNMATGVFNPGFDSSTVFTGAMPRPFPANVDPEVIQQVEQILFVDPYTDQQLQQGVPEYLKRVLANALAMNTEKRKMYILIGPTATGKGVLQEAIKQSFPKYYGTLDLNNLRATRGASNAKDMAYMVPIHDKRIVFSSEVSMQASLCGNKLKSLVAGGDDIVGRQLYQNERVMVNQSTLFVCANDLPSITPMDDAVKNRIGAVFEYSISFMENPRPGSSDKPRDESIKLKFADPRFQDAFIRILLDAYLSEQSDSMAPPTSVTESTNNWVQKSVTLEETLLEQFEITGLAADMVPVKEIKASLGEFKISDVKLGMELKRLTGYDSVTARYHDTVQKVRCGIKIKRSF